MKKIRIAISGAGNRARTLLRNLKTESCNNIEILAAFSAGKNVFSEKPRVTE